MILFGNKSYFQLNCIKGHLDNYPPVRFGVFVKVRVSFRFGGNHKIAPEKNYPLVRVRVWVRVSLAVGG